MILDCLGFDCYFIDFNYDELMGLEVVVCNIVDQVEEVVCGGKVLLIFSDCYIVFGKLLVYVVLVVGVVYYCLVQIGLCCDFNILVEIVIVCDLYYFVVLIGFGVLVVYLFFVYEVLVDLICIGEVLGDFYEVFKYYCKGIFKGLMKIFLKMGIFIVVFYCGVQLFEVVGLFDEVIDLCFIGVVSCIQGVCFVDIENEQKFLVVEVWSNCKLIQQGGLLKFVYGGEYYVYNLDVVNILQVVVQQGDYEKFKEYIVLVDQCLVLMICDLLQVKIVVQLLVFDEVELLEVIFKCFDVVGIFFGVLLLEVYEVLVEVMNILGGCFNFGEGGEDLVCYGMLKSLKIKQVVIGCFGVILEYLVNVEVLQIKVVQGVKFGEGGQLLGGKVNGLIVCLCYVVFGVILILLLLYYDIYFIEDLVQLIFDFKQVNLQVLVLVKLVFELGVGIIVVGVVKVYVDLIIIFGYDGGIGVLLIILIKYVGLFWELGLVEIYQILCGNDLCGKVWVQIDGGLKIGLDVIKVVIFGVESFGFGIVLMIVLGCKYLCICYLNNCVIGVVMQNDKLCKDYFIGIIVMVINFFIFIVMEICEWLVCFGVCSLGELIGCIDLLEIFFGEIVKQQNLDFVLLLGSELILVDKLQFCEVEKNLLFDQGLLVEKMVELLKVVIEGLSGGEYELDICNCD